MFSSTIFTAVLILVAVVSELTAAPVAVLSVSELDPVHDSQQLEVISEGSRDKREPKLLDLLFGHKGGGYNYGSGSSGGSSASASAFAGSGGDGHGGSSASANANSASYSFGPFSASFSSSNAQSNGQSSSGGFFDY